MAVEQKEKKNHKHISEKDRCPFINLVHAVILLFFLVYTLHGIYLGAGISTGNFLADLCTGFSTTGVNEIFTFIGAIAFVLFGIVGIYEFSYANGLRVLYPPIFGILRERRNERTAEIMMRTYYENDKEFIQKFEQERFGSILQVLKIDESQYRHLSYELLRARSMPEENLEELQVKATEIAFNRDFIDDLTKVPHADRVYDAVNYFVNLYTAAYDDRVRSDLGAIMAQYINISIKYSINEIDYIVIPQDSNLLMGLEVGKRLGKPIIYIQGKPRIYKEKCWDGDYECRPGHTNQIIILHDILVTGSRICDVVSKLTSGTFEVRGLFCLAKYEHSDFEPEKLLLEKAKIDSEKIFCLLKTSEAELKERLLKNSR